MLELQVSRMGHDMRVLVAVVALCMAASAARAQGMVPFEAGEGWLGFSMTTPKGERFCTIVRGSGRSALSIRMSKLSTMLQFSEGTERDGPVRTVPIVFRIARPDAAPVEISGNARETPGPGGLVSYFHEAPPAAAFLDDFAKGENVSVVVQKRSHGPITLAGAAGAINALRACFSSL
jgi:hypothetical protein